ncbi:MAG: signal peptidase I [Parabacteroides sp.]|nr:signal peptidase I [Parabacteroides sp.]
MKKVKKWLWNIAFVISLSLCGLVFIQVFLLATFKIPSGSMEPTLQAGDHIAVFKPLYGSRLFNVFVALKGKDTPIYRSPGLQKVHKNDVIVFNAPYYLSKTKLELNLFRYYVKRCQALPGDSAEVELDGKAQKIYIPREGDSIRINSKNQAYYQKLIDWESRIQKKEPTISASGYYRFSHDYYFLVGDNGEKSFDSRHWGLLPDDFIVGKACLIWKSQNINTQTYQWDRCLRWI